MLIKIDEELFQRRETTFHVKCFLTQHILPPMPALEQDDKGVQVDLQDLGYETSGKSENDREESSSTGRRSVDRQCMSVC